ncbi:MAG: ThiF family adenylyltransferase [Acidobacteriia bacterium]|nr:ThiF family adenylyltransferase [Terriglobia bacterium]
MTSENGNSYFACHAAQLPALTRNGQKRLRHARVHISGTGRIGGSLAIRLAEAGVGRVSANDPQKIEQENFGAWAFVRRPDLGKEKVNVLASFFAGRPHFLYEPLIAPTESRQVDSHIQRADLVISCANTVEARLAAERKAIHYRKPILQVAAFDGRRHLKGVITLRLPENRGSACFGCCLNEKQEFPRGEGLLTTVTSSLAAIASNMAVELLSGVHSDFLRQHTLFWIDLEEYRIEAISVKRRPECKVCGRTRPT